jgi:hypothetical protein
MMAMGRVIGRFAIRKNLPKSVIEIQVPLGPSLYQARKTSHTFQASKRLYAPLSHAIRFISHVAIIGFKGTFPKPVWL